MLKNMLKYSYIIVNIVIIIKIYIIRIILKILYYTILKILYYKNYFKGEMKPITKILK